MRSHRGHLPAIRRPRDHWVPLKGAAPPSTALSAKPCGLPLAWRDSEGTTSRFAKAEGLVVRVRLQAQGRRPRWGHRSLPGSLGSRELLCNGPGPRLKLHRLHGHMLYRHRHWHGHPNSKRRRGTKRSGIAGNNSCGASCPRVRCRRVHLRVHLPLAGPAPGRRQGNHRHGAASGPGLHSSLALHTPLACIDSRSPDGSLKLPPLVGTGSCRQGPRNQRSCSPQPCTPLCRPRPLRRRLRTLPSCWARRVGGG